MTKLPRWWRRFKKNVLFTDLKAGRKIFVKTTLDDGTVHYHIELAPK